MSEETVNVNVKVESLNMISRGKIAVEVSVSELEALGFARTVVKPWKPVDGEEYWFISAYNLVSSSAWHDTEVFWCYWEAGNCYQTEAEATKARDKQQASVRVLRRLRELEGVWVADWSDCEQYKYYTCYDCNSHTVVLFSKHSIISAPQEWYSTKEAWEQVIEEIEPDVKRMMGVE